MTQSLRKDLLLPASFCLYLAGMAAMVIGPLTASSYTSSNLIMSAAGLPGLALTTEPVLARR